MAPSVSDVAILPPSEALKPSQDTEPAYPFYLPFSDPTEKFDPPELFKHIDPGARANPAKPNLLGLPGIATFDISPYLGTEIKGIQLSRLTKEGLDELALLTAERKVLIFRDQDFKDLGPERQLEIARHFGPLHKHPWAPYAKGHPEFNIVYRDGKTDTFKDRQGYNRINWMTWHTDVPYEKQPPGTTIFWTLEQPEIGGDTFFLSQVEAYNRLSPTFQKLLEGLYAVHSGVGQAEMVKRKGGAVRREPPVTEHPVVRVHPVTGEKFLFVDPNLTLSIVGFRQEESDALLKFLFDHLSRGVDTQIRARYEAGTVVVWDNRLTLHSATRDFSSSHRRHAVRLMSQAEVPIPARAED